MRSLLRTGVTIVLIGLSSPIFAQSSSVSVQVGPVTGNIFSAPLSMGNGAAALIGPSELYICTGACTVTPPLPMAGYQFCVLNDDNVASAITLAALGGGARYENPSRTGYGTAGTGTLVSAGAVGDGVCLLGRDSTHYLTTTFTGSWVTN